MKRNVASPTQQMMVNRRSILRTAALLPLAAPLGTMLAGCSSGTGDGETVVYVEWGGTPQEQMTEAQLAPFAKATGITVKQSDQADNLAKLTAMVQASRGEWDVFNTITTTFGYAKKKGLLQEIDYSVVSDQGYFQPELISPYGVPQYSYGVCVFWNKEKFKEPMQNWADVWDVEKFPGKRAFESTGDYVFEEALMADGVAPEDVYPLDIPRAIRKLEEIREHATFQDINTIQNLAAQGEVVSGSLQLSRVQELIADGVPLDYTFNNSISDHVWWVVPKHAPNPEAAMKLIAYCQTPEGQLRVFEETRFTPTLTAALDKMDPEALRTSPGTPETTKTSLSLDTEYYAEHHEEMVEAMGKFLRKG